MGRGKVSAEVFLAHSLCFDLMRVHFYASFRLLIVKEAEGGGKKGERKGTPKRRERGGGSIQAQAQTL